MLMLNKNIFILVFIFLSLNIFNSVHASETKTVVLDIPGMTCQFCPITIKKSLQKVDGVTKAVAEYDAKTATVTFDPTVTNVKALIQATTNAGYPSTLKK